MKYIRVVTEPPTGDAIVDYFVVEDDASEEEISEIASDIFYQHCDYGFSEVSTDEDDYDKAVENAQ